MSVRRGTLSLLAATGLALAGLALTEQGTAVAQPDLEEISVTNPLIDCATNPAYDNTYIASAFKAGGGHAGGSMQNCSACHPSDSPTVGSGKPKATAATALIQNNLSEPVSFAVKYGRKGEWKDVELKPGAVQKVSYKYKQPGQNRSPEAWIKYDKPNVGEVEKKLTLVATPNPKLGQVYFFDRDTKGERQAKLWMPTSTVYRTNRR